MAETETVATAVHDWLRERVAGDLDLADDYPLIGNGVLTSLLTVELVVFLEAQFRVDIPDEEVNEENFRTIQSIATFVAERAP